MRRDDAAKNRPGQLAFDYANAFIESAAELYEQVGERPGCYEMCAFVANRSLLAFLCEQGIQFTEEEFVSRHTAKLWESCKEINPRFNEFDREFRLLLSCEWADFPEGKEPVFQNVLAAATRLRDFVAEIAPALSTQTPEPQRGMELQL
jgi:hypothetical protein